jgi:hypothetical protein
MVQALSIVFGIPAAAMGVCYWVMPSKEIKWSWATAGIAYILIYLAIFHLWLKAF